MKLLYCIIYLAFIGILSNFIGDTINRERMPYKSFPFAPFPFEKKGAFYDLFRIRFWKDRVPDMSKLRKSMVKKKLKNRRSAKELTLLAEETCVAEIVHFSLIVFAIPCFFIGGTFCGTISFFIWALGNIPFIMIQRYNRARIISLLSRINKTN